MSNVPKWVKLRCDFGFLYQSFFKLLDVLWVKV
jgi:hypothetical protein